MNDVFYREENAYGCISTFRVYNPIENIIYCTFLLIQIQLLKPIWIFYLINIIVITMLLYQQKLWVVKYGGAPCENT